MWGCGKNEAHILIGAPELEVKVLFHKFKSRNQKKSKDISFLSRTKRYNLELYNIIPRMEEDDQKV